MRKDNNMKNFTKKDLKPNMILRFSDAYEWTNKRYVDFYYLGSNFIVADPKSHFAYLNLEDFTDDICFNTFHLLGVYLPNPYVPFKEDEYTTIWEVNNLDKMEIIVGNEDDKLIFSPNFETYSEADKDEMMCVKLKGVLTPTRDGSIMAISLDDMKHIRNGFTDIIKYVEDKNE